MTRQKLGRRTWSHRLLQLASRQDREWFVDARTDVCIEGYPRSGNSFAVESFRQANPDARIGHHVHVPAQITRAAEFDVPTALVIREPAEAVSSFAVYWAGKISPAVLLKHYIKFHCAIDQHKDEIAICPFSRFIENPAFVARALNRKFGTDYREKGRGADESLSASPQRILDAIQSQHLESFGGDALRSPAPSKVKQALKAEALVAVTRSGEFDAAVALYEGITAAAGAPAVDV